VRRALTDRRPIVRHLVLVLMILALGLVVGFGIGGCQVRDPYELELGDAGTDAEAPGVCAQPLPPRCMVTNTNAMWQVAKWCPRSYCQRACVQITVPWLSQLDALPCRVDENTIGVASCDLCPTVWLPDAGFSRLEPSEVR